VRAALAEVYGRADAALAPAASACRACGKCCRFEPGGIVLFASAIELAYLVTETSAARAPTVRSGSRSLAGESSTPPARAPELTLGARKQQVDTAWRCPYQQGALCAARGARLLGCRTYFCDAGARELGEGVYADALREIQRIAAGQGPWWYGPARAYFDHV
jgi:Fe-S-cluster containining protein